MRSVLVPPPTDDCTVCCSIALLDGVVVLARRFGFIPTGSTLPLYFSRSTGFPQLHNVHFATLPLERAAGEGVQCCASMQFC